MDIIIAVVTVLLSGSISVWVAKKYGDVAGTEAAIAYEKEKAAKARIIALQALLNEVTRIRSLAGHNAALSMSAGRLIVQPVTKMPVAAFETAFLSRQSSLLGPGEDSPDKSELMGSVVAYLTKASAINTLVDLYVGLVKGLTGTEENRRDHTLQDTAQKSKEMASLLDELEKHLGQALEGQN